MTGSRAAPWIRGSTACGLLRRLARARRGERAVEVFDDVVGVFEPDTEANGLRPHAGAALFLGRHLAMGGGGRMAAQRARVADVDQPLDQLQRVIEPLGRLEA